MSGHDSSRAPELDGKAACHCTRPFPTLPWAFSLGSADGLDFLLPTHVFKLLCSHNVLKDSVNPLIQYRLRSEK